MSTTSLLGLSLSGIVILTSIYLLIRLLQIIYVVSETVREYNRLIKQRQREREKQYKEMYQDVNVFGISFTAFVEQQKLSTWKKLSMTLSDEELKLARLAFKLSDEQLRKLVKGDVI